MKGHTLGLNREHWRKELQAGIIIVIYPFTELCVLLLQVDSAWQRGDYDRARRSSANARGWSIAAIITGVILATVAGIAGGVVRGIYYI